MRRLNLTAVIFFGLTLLLSAQRSKVIGVFQLLEDEKYEESKRILEEALKRKSTRNWPKTWYARGVLCQKAYKKGMDKNNEDLYSLYSDQLYVAFSSFEKARFLDKHGKYAKLLPPRYVILANDLIKAGETHYKKDEFDEAYRAFEYALRINRGSYLTVARDTNLMYNTALSAYKSQNWDEAIEYLTELNEGEYSSNIPHLMFAIYMMQSDTLSARKVLAEGINKYEDNEELVLLMVDLLFNSKDTEKAVEVLQEASKNDSLNYSYPYNIGLLYQKTEDYTKAIEAYKSALTLPSDTVKVYTSIGTCYYNIGAEIDKRARSISNNYRYLKEKEKSAAAFTSSLQWYENAYGKDSKNKEVVAKLRELYIVLGEKEKLLALP